MFNYSVVRCDCGLSKKPNSINVYSGDSPWK
jgi:hypothetical protein